MSVTPIPKEEAIHRILEGRHQDYEGHDDPQVNAALIEALQNGDLEAGLRDGEILCFRKAPGLDGPPGRGRRAVRPGYRVN